MYGYPSDDEGLYENSISLVHNLPDPHVYDLNKFYLVIALYNELGNVKPSRDPPQPSTFFLGNIWLVTFELLLRKILHTGDH